VMSNKFLELGILDNEETKKILCIKKKCKICPNAHSIKEQIINDNRQHVLDILEMKNLSEINLQSDRILFETLKIFTKACDDCKQNKCIYGINCTKGAPVIITPICYDDLITGTCTKNNECKNTHLTEKKLIPYNKKKLYGVRIIKDPYINKPLLLPILNEILLKNERIFCGESEENDFLLDEEWN